MSNAIQIQKVGWWHERLAEAMIAHPEKKLKEIAVEFKVTPQWIYMLKNSDVFMDYWNRRSAEHGKAVTASITAKGFAVSELALDLIAERLETQGEVMSTAQLLDVVDVNMKRFNYNSDKKGSGPVINMNFGGLVTAPQLEEARALMRAKTSQVIEAQPSPAIANDQPEKVEE